jgi:hypothetical protein
MLALEKASLFFAEELERLCSTFDVISRCARDCRFIVLVSVGQLLAYLIVAVWGDEELADDPSNDDSNDDRRGWGSAAAAALAPSALAFAPVAPFGTSGGAEKCGDRRRPWGPGGGRLLAYQVPRRYS